MSQQRNHRSTAIELRKLEICAGDERLLDDVDATFEAGEITLIVGASGAGKSVLLRVLSGLVDDSESAIRFSGTIKFGSDSSEQGSIGIVFQNFALFDELSPRDNVRFAAAHGRSAAGATEDSVNGVVVPEDYLDELGVPASTRTASLSGGQRQRLAIARTLAYRPSLILYDEPTSGLDAATAATVAALIQETHDTHPTTSVVVTHDYEAFAPIANKIYLLEPSTRDLIEIPADEWPQLRDRLHPTCRGDESADTTTQGTTANRVLNRCSTMAARFLVATSRTVEQIAFLPIWLLTLWRHPLWGARFVGHYMRLVAGPSAWLYIAVAGGIIGFVTTYFTFRFLPYAQYTKPLLIEDLLMSMGFALYRIFVPVLATILIAARCGAAVAADIGGKAYGQQIDALRTFHATPERYLLTSVTIAFLVGTPFLYLIGYASAAMTSLIVFVATHPDRGADFWGLHFHRELSVADSWYYHGSGWLLAKTLICAFGIALIAYRSGVSPRYSASDVSRGVTTAIFWSTLFVLVIHFAFAFYEFEPR